MSLDQCVINRPALWVYSAPVGEYLALRLASGEPDTSLAALHRFDPDGVPPPLVVRRWRNVWPAFDALMVEAEQARAAALMDQTIEIADDDTKLAANAKNGIAARWRLAESLAPERFGQRRILAGDANAPLRLGAAPELTDAQLMAIARGSDPMALLSGPSAARADAGDPGHPTSPPVERERGFKRGDEREPSPTDIPTDEYPEPPWVPGDDGFPP